MTPNKLPPLPEPNAWLRIFEDDGEPIEEFSSSAKRPENWPIGDCVAIYYGCTVREHTAEALRQSQSLPAGAVAWLESEPGTDIAELHNPDHPLHYYRSCIVHIGAREPAKKQEANVLFPLYTALQADAREKGESPSLNQIPKPCAYPPVDSETGADTGSCCHHAYADGWNECRDEAIRLATQPVQASEKVSPDVMAKAWRNLYINGRTEAHRILGDSYEMARARAESDAIQFEDEFREQVAKRATSSQETASE